MNFFKIICVFTLVALLPAFLCAEEGAKATPLEKDSAAEGTNAAVTVAETPVDSGFERYRTILDRMPFGPEPANFNPDTPAERGGVGVGGAADSDPAAQEAARTQEEQKILASVRISALNVTPSGKIAVGFTDASKQPAGTYYLKVGETRDGWTVKSADAREMKVTLEKDGIEATLGLGEGNADAGKDGKKGGKAAGGAHPPIARLARAGLLRAGAPHAPAAEPAIPAAGGSAIANLRARRAQKEAERKEEEARQAAAAEQAKADRERAAADRERAAAEREQQRETLLQIQEELRRQREAKEQAAQDEEQPAQSGD